MATHGSSGHEDAELPQSELDGGNDGDFETPPDTDGDGAGGDEGGEGGGAGGFSAPGGQPSARALDERLVQLKNEIEQQLLGGAERSAGVRSATAYSGTGNICGVGIGTGFDGDLAAAGAEPGGVALNVYVVEASGADEVRRSLVDSFGARAASDDHVPINVIVTGEIDAFSHRMKMRPAPCGISVAHYKVTAGTLGALAVGRSAPRNRRLMILSNNHVLANSNSASYGDAILQPGPYDGGVNPRDKIAILERFVAINFSGGWNYVDAATGWAWPDRVRKEFIRLVGGHPAFFRVGSSPAPCQVGLAVGKSGRTTQLTRGVITDCSASFTGINYGSGKKANFRDQIVIKSATSSPFSAGGDSGSLIWTWDAARRPVGLLFAGSTAITIANKIGRVLTALDISLRT